MVGVVFIYAVWSLYGQYDENKRSMERHRKYRQVKLQIIQAVNRKKLDRTFMNGCV